jgi:hypothetical protein
MLSAAINLTNLLSLGAAAPGDNSSAILTIYREKYKSGVSVGTRFRRRPDCAPRRAPPELESLACVGPASK